MKTEIVDDILRHSAIATGQNCSPLQELTVIALQKILRVTSRLRPPPFEPGSLHLSLKSSSFPKSTLDSDLYFKLTDFAVLYTPFLSGRQLSTYEFLESRVDSPTTHLFRSE